MLTDYCDNGLTDKNTVHSYLEVYQSLFEQKQLTATQVLEVGIGPYIDSNAGSIRMWAKFFPNAEVHGCDVISIDAVHPCVINHPRIHLHTSNNAYNQKFIATKFTSKGIKFDIVVDDGPHTLESMIQFITLYLPLLKADGILVIEDVQNIAWLETLTQVTPDAFKKYIKTYDRRSVKGRYDDIMFVINMTCNE